MQHTLDTGTRGAEFRHFLVSNCGTVWTITKFTRTFAPLTTFGNLEVKPRANLVIVDTVPQSDAKMAGYRPKFEC
jgi:hypothetical protein